MKQGWENKKRVVTLATKWGFVGAEWMSQRKPRGGAGDEKKKARRRKMKKT